MADVDSARTRDPWWRRNWKWALPLVVLVPLLTCTGTAFFVALQVFGLMLETEPVQLSLAQVRAQPEVQAALGTPIEPGRLATGDIKLGGPQARANVTYRVSGPQGKATVHLEADTSTGAWQFTTHTIYIEETRRTIDLTADEDDGS